MIVGERPSSMANTIASGMNGNTRKKSVSRIKNASTHPPL